MVAEIWDLICLFLKKLTAFGIAFFKTNVPPQYASRFYFCNYCFIQNCLKLLRGRFYT
jgi:hypothetical protein